MSREPCAAPVVASCDPPAPGQAVEVTPGILWARLALPYAPGHVNAYLLEDGGNWVVVDTGLDDAPTRAAWEGLLAGPLAARPVTRVLVTHWHSDHMGLAGWLCERFGAELLMSESEYLHSLVRKFAPQPVKDDIQRRFLLSHGLDAATTEEWVRNGHFYLELLHPVPQTFRRLTDGDSLRIGPREFHVMTAAGHSPESVLLHCTEDNLLLCADQVIPGFVPNISVQAFEPEGDPLGLYLRSLDRLARVVPDDALILPGHDVVCRGLGRRVAEIRDSFEARAAAVVAACRDAPRSVGDLLPILFRKPIGPVWIGFVAGDLLSLLHFMSRRGALDVIREQGQVAFLATGAAS